ncbi:MAG: AI-2E family transporter [Proteobacteria bacterium]|nr:AI-2E family transporter [Pseudomonadota bacterium]
MFLVTVLGYLSYRILAPFLSAVAWAIVLSIVFYPLYSLSLKLVKWKYAASFFTLCMILLLIFGPFSYFSYLLTQELNSLIEYIKAGKFDTIDKILQHPGIRKIVYKILSLLNMSEGDLQNTITNNVSELGRQSIVIIKSGIGNVATAAIDFVFMLLSTFFFLEDGPAFLEKFSSYMPFSKKEREKLTKQVRDIVISTIYGGITVAIVQGLIGGITLSLLGVHSPVVWGLAMFITSFIPLLGTLVVWGPIAGYLFFQGLFLKGVILVLVGIFGISMADNILRPLIIKGKMKMPTLVIFFSILGGIKLFGFIGFIMGPLVLALFMSIVEVFRYSEERTSGDGN